MIGRSAFPWMRSWHRQVHGAIAVAQLMRRLGAADVDTETAAALAALLGRLRGPVTKFAQVLATLPTGVPEELVEACAGLHAHAPPMGRLFMARRLRHALGADWRTHFADFEEQPRFAASFGQVHDARLADGRSVAVKIQYPDMDSVLAADLRTLRMTAPVIRRITGIDPDAVIAELAERFAEELDYTHEAANMIAWRRALARHLPEDRATAPRPLPELTRRRVLVMTWMAGAHLTTIAPRLSQQLRDRIAADLLRAWYGPFFAEGLLHGDPHPGNILWQEQEREQEQEQEQGGGRLALLDFGCLRRYREEEVAGVRRLLPAVRGADAGRLAAALHDIGFRDLDAARVAALRPWLEWLFAPFLEPGARPFLPPEDLAAARVRLAETRNRLKAVGGIRLPRAFLLLHRSAVVLGSVITRLGARGNWRALWEEVADSRWQA